jgi:hypothetical protein
MSTPRHELTLAELHAWVEEGHGTCVAFSYRGMVDQYEPRLKVLRDPEDAFTDPTPRQRARFRKALESAVSVEEFFEMLRTRGLAVVLDHGGFPQVVGTLEVG